MGNLGTMLAEDIKNHHGIVEWSRETERSNLPKYEFAVGNLAPESNRITDEILDTADIEPKSRFIMWPLHGETASPNSAKSIDDPVSYENARPLKTNSNYDWVNVPKLNSRNKFISTF